jgi:hypothetical protein
MITDESFWDGLEPGSWSGPRACKVGILADLLMHLRMCVDRKSK